MRLTKFALATGCLFLTFIIPDSSGQSPAPKLGYFRFWNMSPATSGVFEVRKANGAVPEPTMLVGTAYRYTGYGEYPAGRYRLGVYRQGENRPLKIFDVDLKPDSYFTILASPQSIDLFDDTPDPNATTGTLTVRNYFSGATIAVSSGTQKIIDALQYGQSHAVTGLPLSRYPVTVRTQLPNGRPAEAGAEVDFTISRRATLLAMPDSYGRFRARVTFDGKNL